MTDNEYSGLTRTEALEEVYELIDRSIPAAMARALNHHCRPSSNVSYWDQVAFEFERGMKLAESLAARDLE